MIVARLFEAMLDLGVVVVATSNRLPDDLYKGGLQRDRFLPFIDLLKARLEVVHLDGATDYRLDRLKTMAVYVTPVARRGDGPSRSNLRRLDRRPAGAVRRLRPQGPHHRGAAGGRRHRPLRLRRSLPGGARAG